MTTLDEAKRRCVCRICEAPIDAADQPRDWKEMFGIRMFPKPAVALYFGKEFAHVDCLKPKETTP